MMYAVHWRLYCCFEICKCNSCASFCSQPRCWLAGILSTCSDLLLSSMFMARNTSFRFLVDHIILCFSTRWDFFQTSWASLSSFWDAQIRKISTIENELVSARYPFMAIYLNFYPWLLGGRFVFESNRYSSFWNNTATIYTVKLA